MFVFRIRFSLAVGGQIFVGSFGIDSPREYVPIVVNIEASLR
jgi:hypothetical protein